MIRTAIFGAGQAGIMVSKWLPATHELICFIDNDKDKQGFEMQGLPVMALDQAIKLKPDRIWIATLNTEAAESIRNQIRSAGFDGSLRYAHEFRNAQDIRIAGLRLLAKEINGRATPGAVAELGVYKGEFASEMSRLFPDKDLYLFDTFEGFCEQDLAKENDAIGHNKPWHPDFSDTTVEHVRAMLPHPEKAHFIVGRFPLSAEQLTGNEKYSFVNIDPDLYEPTIQGLKYFWPRMVRNGIIMIHDYNSMQFPGVRKAVQEFTDENCLMPLPLADLHGTAVLVRH